MAENDRRPTPAEVLVGNGLAAMQRQAAEYDRPGGERSAAKVAAAWSAATGKDMTEPEAWLFLVMLKAVRLIDSPGPHDDSAADGAAYFGLMGEAKQRAKPPAPADPQEWEKGPRLDWDRWLGWMARSVRLTARQKAYTAAGRAEAFLRWVGMAQAVGRELVREVCQVWDGEFGRGTADSILLGDAERKAGATDQKPATPPAKAPAGDRITAVVSRLRGEKPLPGESIHVLQRRLGALIEEAAALGRRAVWEVRAAWDATYGGGSADMLVGSLPASEWQDQDAANRAEYESRERAARRNGPDAYTPPDAGPSEAEREAERVARWRVEGKLPRVAARVEPEPPCPPGRDPWPPGGDGPIPTPSPDAVSWQHTWAGSSGKWWEIRNGWSRPRPFPAASETRTEQAQSVAPESRTVEVPPVPPFDPLGWSGDPRAVTVDLGAVGLMCDQWRTRGRAEDARTVEVLAYWALLYQELYAATIRRVAFPPGRAFQFVAVRRPPSFADFGVTCERVVNMVAAVVRQYPAGVKREESGRPPGGPADTIGPTDHE